MTEQHPRIFFSYRRTNLRLVDHLHEKFLAAFKPGAIFLDRQDIGPGAMFPDLLREAVDQAVVVLAIIEPTWISIQDERTLSRRLELEDDWVRQELERALANGTTIIPVLVDGANIFERRTTASDIATVGLEAVRPAWQRDLWRGRCRPDREGPRIADTGPAGRAVGRSDQIPAPSRNSASTPD